jgi:hypothetical protein
MLQYTLNTLQCTLIRNKKQKREGEEGREGERGIEEDVPYCKDVKGLVYPLLHEDVGKIEQEKKTREIRVRWRGGKYLC